MIFCCGFLNSDSAFEKQNMVIVYVKKIFILTFIFFMCHNQNNFFCGKPLHHGQGSLLQDNLVCSWVKHLDDNQKW